MLHPKGNYSYLYVDLRKQRDNNKYSHKMTTNEKIAALRAVMQAQGVDAVIIPSSDSHQSEYSAPHFALRAWISGFSGSAGTVVVTASHAGLWTDSRYFLQAEQQLGGSEVALHKLQVQTAAEWVGWVADNLPQGAVVGIDGHVFSLSSVLSMQATLAAKGIKLRIDFDPAQIWTEGRPAMPQSDIYVHDVHTAGLSAREKTERVRRFIAEKGAQSILIDALDEVAYTLNIRGADVAYNPVTYAYLAITDKSAILFTDPGKLPSEVKNYLRSAAIEVRPYEAVEDWLARETGETICIDPAKFSAYHTSLLPKTVKVVECTSPVVMMKCVKNASEIEGEHRAMLKDAIALAEFYRLAEEESERNGWDEADLGALVGSIRAKQPGYISESFAPIVGFRENGAIVHYSPKKGSAKKIQGSGMLLIDSGGQYADGTTDITRTLYIGTPSDEEKRAYTAVLKTHIAIELLVFPQGYSGTQLDAAGRFHMWALGYNYGHGTGHGVGAAMNVHEGPISFGNRGVNTGVAFEPGMIISDEPGYYKTGAFGIRIENCVLVREAFENENGRFLGFAPLTLAPIETKLVDVSMMTDAELEWLNAYHAHVLDKVLPHLSGEDARWLAQKCSPLFRAG